MYDGFGQSKAGAKNASDTPLVNVSGKEFTSYFTNIDVGLEYTAQDILAMRFANNNLVSRLRDRAMRSNFEFMNQLAFFGNEELKIDGLLTHQHINNKEAVVKGKSGKIEWKEKTANEIVEDVMAAYNNALDATNNMIVPDTLLISLKALNLLKSKIFNSFDSCTVFRHLENTLNCTIKGLHELNDAFTGGTNGFVFFNNDREYVEQLMPVSFEATEPQQNAWTYTVYCRSRYGGLVIRQPKMFVMRHGI
jgi:hypothetical protein